MSRRHAPRWRSWAPALPTIAALVLTGTCPAARAAPYYPGDDSTVLERVPARSELERLAPLRAAVHAAPEDPAPALQLAAAYIELGRRSSDPRFVSYAQSVLTPWLARAHPPEPALVLQAIALQYLHQFDRALALLARALELAPLDGQAWVTRAALLELRGDFGAARQSCAHLARAADQYTALTCLASVDGRSGRLAASATSLAGLHPMDTRLPPALRAWKLAVGADMAERLGDDAAAEAALRAALGVTPEDPYLKAAYADLLLRLGRPREVIELVGGCEAQDALLLRLAIAGRRAASPQAQRWAQIYAARQSAAERAGDLTHDRERALYLLDVAGDVQGALAAAARNWSVQREPADVRIYLRAARAAHSPPDQAAIAAWLAASRYEDRTLALSADGSRS